MLGGNLGSLLYGDVSVMKNFVALPKCHTAWALPVLKHLRVHVLQNNRIELLAVYGETLQNAKTMRQLSN